MPADKRKKPTTKRARINEAPDAATKRAAIEILKPKTGPETPPLDVLIKLGSLLVHAEEYFDGLKASGIAPQTLTPTAAFDYAAINTLLGDESLQAWRVEMRALLPVKREDR
jgi:hypothetical protein